MVIVYGIKNCTTVKKARDWLDGHAICYRFHDFRADGLSLAQLHEFAQQLGWEALLNRNSTSWRQLAEHQRQNLDETSAMQLMLTTPTLIKRPVVATGQQILIGFKPTDYASAFNLAE